MITTTTITTEGITHTANNERKVGTTMTRYEQGFLAKCAEYGVDGSRLMNKNAGVLRTLAPLAIAGGLGYLGSRIFNTDVVGGKMPVKDTRSPGVNNMSRNTNYYGNGIDYTKRRLIVNDLLGGLKGARNGALLGVPTAIALGLLRRGRGGMPLANRITRLATKGLGIGLAGGAVSGAGMADANARLRMWEGRDPVLDTVAIAQR